MLIEGSSAQENSPMETPTENTLIRCCKYHGTSDQEALSTETQTPERHFKAREALSLTQWVEEYTLGPLCASYTVLNTQIKTMHLEMHLSKVLANSTSLEM